jgi:hypothetical protein
MPQNITVNFRPVRLVATSRLPLALGRYGSTSASQGHPVCWSSRMQMSGQIGGQVECNYPAVADLSSRRFSNEVQPEQCLLPTQR